jgi:hypothetical protein
VTFLAAQIQAVGKTPFLHVKSGNGAKEIYQQIGFRLLVTIWLTVISSAEGVVSCGSNRHVAALFRVCADDDGTFNASFQCFQQLQTRTGLHKFLEMLLSRVFCACRRTDRAFIHLGLSLYVEIVSVVV